MLKVLFLFLSLASAAIAADVTLAWDHNPTTDNVTKYTLYEQQGSAWTKVSDTTLNQHVIQNVSVGLHTYAVTASNAWGESPRSVSVSTPPGLPGSPKNPILINISVTVP